MVRRLGPVQLQLAALGAFGLATVVSQIPTIILAGLGTAGLWRSIRASAVEGHDLSKATFGLIALFALLSMVGPARIIGSPPDWLFLASGIAWLALGLGWLLLRSAVSARRSIYFLCLAITAALGAVHVVSAAGVGFDVLFFHEAAADALADGVSPYSDAVQVPNGAPDSDEFIVGYPYPPISALAYSASDWAFGDPRWTSLIGWLIVLGVLGARSWRADGGDQPLGTMLIAASIPAWPLVLTTGWTESVSVALLALTVLTWARPGVSGAMSGFFLGSKQYLVAAAPLLVANKLPDRWKRAVWAVLAAVVSFVPVLIWGVPDFIDAAIRFHLETPARPDGSSIVGVLAVFGVDWAPPTWIMVVAVGGIVLALWRLIADASSWLAAIGVTLAVALFLSGQAFTNYWFLIAGVAALALVSRDDSVHPDASTAGAEPIESHSSEKV